MYLSFLPLCLQSYLVGIPDGGGILTKVVKGAGSSIQYHYIGRSAGGAYPFIVDKYGAPTGDTLNMNNNLLTIYNQQVTAMFTSLGYTATLGSDDHVSANATSVYSVPGPVPTTLQADKYYVIMGIFDVVDNPVIYLTAAGSSPSFNMAVNSNDNDIWSYQENGSFVDVGGWSQGIFDSIVNYLTSIYGVQWSTGRSIKPIREAPTVEDYVMVR